VIHFAVGGRSERKMAPKDDEDEPVKRLASCLLRHRWTDKLYLVLGIEEDEGMQLLHTRRIFLVHLALACYCFIVAGSRN
jgi:hypothetical protein